MSLMKRIDEARRAFERGDTAAAVRLHENLQHGRERTALARLGGVYLGDMVYGGLDGIITTFAVVSGVAGAQLDANIILILGIANLLADGFSMGTGAYLSAKAEQEYYGREARRQMWEIEYVPDGQKAELKQLYLNRGYADADAQTLVDLETANRDHWVRAMMIEELGLLKDDSRPIYSSLATFIAFVVAGSLPLLVYFLGLVSSILPETAFIASMILSGVALFALGAAKVLVTRLNPIRSGLEMLVVGGLAAGVAYVVGALLKNVGGG